MLIGQHLFRGNSEIDMLFRIFSFKGTPISDRPNSVLAKNLMLSSSNGKKETTAKSKKYEEELDQPKMKKFENYPHLVKYGAKFPQFKK